MTILAVLGAVVSFGSGIRDFLWPSITKEESEQQHQKLRGQIVDDLAELNRQLEDVLGQLFDLGYALFYVDRSRPGRRMVPYANGLTMDWEKLEFEERDDSYAVGLGGGVRLENSEFVELGEIAIGAPKGQLGYSRVLTIPAGDGTVIVVGTYLAAEESGALVFALGFGTRRR